VVVVMEKGTVVDVGGPVELAGKQGG
jgi:hypothetical protein